MAEWVVTHNKVLGQMLLMAGIVSAVCVRTKTRRVRLWFIGAMGTIAIACVALIPFLP